MSGAGLQRVVHAKLRSTGDYTLAGWSSGLTRPQAEAYAFKSTPGNISLGPGEVALASFVTDAGSHLVAATMLGSWSDSAGRPWLYRHLVLIPQQLFEQLGCDPFVLMGDLAKQEEFKTQSIALRDLPPPVLSPGAPAERQLHVLESVRGDARLPAVLASVFNGSGAYWVAGEESLRLLEACVAILPLSARKCFTFVSRAAQRPELDAIVLVSSRPIAGMGDGRSAPLMIAGQNALEVPQGPGSSAARTVCRWITSNDGGGIERWRATADQFVVQLGQGPSWTAVADALVRSVVWVEKIGEVERNGIVPPLELERLLREAAGTALRPPAASVTGLVACLSVPSVGVVDAALRLVADAPSPILRSQLLAAVGESWARTTAALSDWRQLLDRVSELPTGAQAVVDAAARWFVNEGRQQHLLEIAAGVERDRPWSQYWAEAVAREWESSLGEWHPGALCDVVIQPFRERPSIPSLGWVEEFGKRYSQGGGTLAACAVEASRLRRNPEPAVASLARLAFAPEESEARSLAENLLLWALLAGDSPLTFVGASRAARDAMAQEGLGLASAGDAPRPTLRRVLLRILVADGRRLAYPKLSVCAEDDLRGLHVALNALPVARECPEVDYARLWVATAGLAGKAETVQRDAAAQLVERCLSSATWPLESAPDVIITSLLECSRYRRIITPRARGRLLWHVLAAASAAKLASQSIVERIGVLAEREVNCDAWPVAPLGGQPLLSLESVEALVRVGRDAGDGESWRSVAKSAAENIGTSERRRGVTTAVASIMESLEQLRTLCLAQETRNPREPIQVSALLRELARSGALRRSVGRSIRKELPRRVKHFRLTRKRGWK